MTLTIYCTRCRCEVRAVRLYGPDAADLVRRNSRRRELRRGVRKRVWNECSQCQTAYFTVALPDRRPRVLERLGQLRLLSLCLLGACAFDASPSSSARKLPALEGGGRFALEPDAGDQLEPDAGDQLEPDAGELEPDAGELEPDAGELEPDASSCGCVFCCPACSVWPCGGS